MLRQNKYKLPKEILSEYYLVKQFSTGGSSAKTLLVKKKTNDRLEILKFATWSGIGSSGIPWLKAQANRFTELKRKLSYKAKESIPEIFTIYDRQNLFYYTMEYYANAYPLSILYFENERFEKEDFLRDTNKILDLLCNHFYSQGSLTTPKNYIQNVHIARVKHRLRYLVDKKNIVYQKYIDSKIFRTEDNTYKDLGYFFNELFKTKSIVINGQEYSNGLTILEKYNSKEKSDSLKPAFLPKYNHGDSTFRNYLKTPEKIIMIDVRGVNLPDGTPSRICIPYELGKMLRSFLLEIIRSNNFTIKIKKSKEEEFEFTFIYDIKNQGVKKLIEMRSILPSFFENHQGLKIVLRKDNDWLMKAYFSEACHFLADAPNRLEGDLSGQQTIAYYLIGNLLLSDFDKLF